MPPKGKAKSKAAKARAKAARLAMAQAAAAAAAGEAGAEGEVVEGGVLAIPAPKPKAKAGGFAKKIMNELGDRSVEEATEEYNKRKKVAEESMDEALKMEKDQQAQADETKAEYDKAAAEVAENTSKELTAATEYKALVAKRSEYSAQIAEHRNALYEAQKKVAMLEVLAVNHAKLKALEDTRRMAQEAAAEAKRVYAEQKLREKEALEETRRALAASRAEAKGRGRGAKRAADGTVKEAADDMADTLPATQAADID
jgi:hypothetical protein